MRYLWPYSVSYMFAKLISVEWYAFFYAWSLDLFRVLQLAEFISVGWFAFLYALSLTLCRVLHVAKLISVEWYTFCMSYRRHRRFACRPGISGPGESRM